MSRVRTNDFEQTDYAIGRTYLASMCREGQGRTGLFVSMHGYVRIFESDGRRKSTFMVFIHGGRTWSRNWKAIWGDLTLARLAREFVEEVVGG